MKQKNLAKHYNEIYQEKGNGFRGGEAMHIVQQIPEYLGGGTALDIGGGVGRNTLFLARNNFTVDVVDLSEVGLSKITNTAKQERLPVTVTLGDITKLGITKEYDVIVSAYMLHHLEDHVARKLICDIQNHIKPGGITVIGTFTKEGDFYRMDRADEHFFPDLGEISKIFKDWEILSYEEKLSTALRKRKDGTQMVNTAAIMLARKPK